MQINNSTSVASDSYLADFKLLADKCLHMDRKIILDRTMFQIDVLARHWAFSWGDFPPGRVKMLRRGEWIAVEGFFATFIPPREIVEWQIAAGEFQFETIFSNSPIPDDIFNRSIGCQLDGMVTPRSELEVFEIIRQAKNTVLVGREEDVSATARKTKEAIDKTYNEDISLAELAQTLNVSHTVMGRAFKRNYGLTPVAYRTKLRVMDSFLSMLMKDQSVSEAAFDAGFNDLSRHNRQFRKEFKVRPSLYR